MSAKDLKNYVSNQSKSCFIEIFLNTTNLSSRVWAYVLNRSSFVKAVKCRYGVTREATNTDRLERNNMTQFICKEMTSSK